MRRVEEVERRLAELRSQGGSLLPEAQRESSEPPWRQQLPSPPGLMPPRVEGQEAVCLAAEPAAEASALVLTEEVAPPEQEERQQLEHVSQPPVRIRRLRLGEILLRRNLITQAQLDQALEHQRHTGERLGSVLVNLGFVTMQDMVTALGEQLGVEVILQDRVEIDPSARGILPLDFIRRHEVVPLWANDKILRIAMADPTNLAIVDEVRFLTGRWVEVVLAAEATVRALIANEFSSDSVMSEIINEGSGLDLEKVELEQDEEEKSNVYDLIQESSGRPVVNFVNFLLTDSVRRRASDVHIEPYETSLRVRFRIDGELQTIVSPPQRLHVPVISRIKVMAGLDISKRRIPQDGHLAVRYDGQVFHYRVSMLPTVYGEKCVMRLLTKEAELADLSRLGLPEPEERRLRKAIAAPQGLVLVTGPTGSGKTTTVHAALNAISKPSINITTLEDPVETTLPGINHVQINEAAGMGFADALRSLLRQDPDVVFVGEMRDAEVSSIAIRASLTGHLVLSTLHTNSAMECFDRLDDMGVERYLVAATIQTVVAQRLLRRVCDACAEPIALEQAVDESDLAEFRQRWERLGLPATIQRGRGCEACLMTGYRRRVGVYEVLPIDRQIRDMLRRKVAPEQLEAALRERGFRSMYENGLLLCAQGLTTPSEVERVLARSD
ncbi:MAG: ATPase, T2SS/T4P/T4SS family [Myxococcales bacterium]|nr:ATPase, T2SS/T4P/T4SS family [Myxococcota bacterium]MDW8280838.1 ATPase, T2SS/T4P/T4SS family [Myxococcales bacterium]